MSRAGQSRGIHQSKGIHQTKGIDRDVGIVLSGGGAYAAYEAGVMRAILAGETVATGYRMVDPGVVTGTSAGALNASLMISRLDSGVLPALDYLEHVWLEDLASRPPFGDNGVFRFRLDPLPFLDPRALASDPLRSFVNLASDGASLARTLIRRGSNFALSTGKISARAMGLLDLAALIAADALPVTLRRVLDLKALQRSERVISVAAANWTTGSIELFGNQDLAGEHGYEAVRASTAIPGIFQPVTIGDSVYMDGGLIMNTPLKPAIDAGASTLHVIYVDPLVRNIPSSKLNSTMDIFQRAMAISFAAATNRDIETAAQVNEGLRAGGEKKSAAALSRRKSRPTTTQPWRLLTIHRYNPQHDLGSGMGILDFRRDPIKALIERGFQDAIRHDCATSGCVIGESSAPAT
jgi:predicted acylesterase/phospholipase RssA